MKGQALIYCRVSTLKQEQEGSSLDTQEQACIAFAREHGYEIGRVTREQFSGAELWDRPLLARDRADIKAGSFDALISYSTDRLSRDPIHLAIIADECARHKAELVFVSEPLDSTPEGALIRYVKGYAAAIEREKIKERSKRGKMARIQSGKLFNYGAELYGYRRDKEAGRRIVQIEEAAQVRRVFTWALEGVSLHEMCRRLNAEAVPPPSVGKMTRTRAPRWNKSTVHRLLAEPSYMGVAYANRWKAVPGKCPEELPIEDRIRLPDGTAPAIVSPDVWEAAAERLRTNRGAATRNQEKARQYLLRGLIVCAVCGRPMYANPERGARTYRCSSRSTPAGPCGGQRVPADNLIPPADVPRDRLGHTVRASPDEKAALSTLAGVESWVWGHIEALLRDPSIVAREAERMRDQGAGSALEIDRQAAERTIARLEGQQTRLLRLYATGDEEMPLDAIRDQLAAIKKQIEQWKTTRADIDRKQTQERQAVEQLDALTAYCERVAANLTTFGFEEKRLALEALGVRILANGRDWIMEGSVPLDTATGDMSITSGGSGRGARFRFSFRNDGTMEATSPPVAAE